MIDLTVSTQIAATQHDMNRKHKEKKEEKEIVITARDIDEAKIRGFVEGYIENVLEEDDYILLSASHKHTKWAVLQYERSKLILTILHLMLNMMKEMNDDQIAAGFYNQEFEFMEFISYYKECGDPISNAIWWKLNNPKGFRVLEDKYDDDQNPHDSMPKSDIANDNDQNMSDVSEEFD